MKCRKEDSISGWRIPYGPGTHQCASFYLHGRICPCQPGLSCFPGQPAKCRAISAETPCLQPNNRREEWSTGISSLPHHEKERNICQKRRLQTKQATPKKGRCRQSPPAFQILSESDRCTDFKIRKENPLQTSALNGYYLYHPGRPFWKRSGNVHLPRMVSGSAKAALR